MKRKQSEDESSQNQTSADFFGSLKLSPSDHLLEPCHRTVCLQCKKSRSWYCPECKKMLLKNGPAVKLPMDLDIIHHPLERLSKSTAVHACVLSDQQVQMHDFPDIPQYDPADTVPLPVSRCCRYRRSRCFKIQETRRR
eukprot:925259_1